MTGEDTAMYDQPVAPAKVVVRCIDVKRGPGRCRGDSFFNSTQFIS
jgi:hypothetical protein